MNIPKTNLSDGAGSLVDSAAHSADQAIRSTQRTANDTLDHLSNRVEDARANAAPVLQKFAADAEKLTRRGLEAVRDGSQRLTEQAQRATDSTIGYIKDEPVK